MGRRASRCLLAFHRLYFLVCLVLFLSGRLKKRLSYFPREQSLSHFKKLSLREKKKISFERACNGSLTTRCACQFYSTEILQKLRAKVGVHRHCLKRDRYFLGTALSPTRPPPPSIDAVWGEAVCQAAFSTPGGARPFIPFHICKEIFIPLRASKAQGWES